MENGAPIPLIGGPLPAGTAQRIRAVPFFFPRKKIYFSH